MGFRKDFAQRQASIIVLLLIVHVLSSSADPSWYESYELPHSEETYSTPPPDQNSEETSVDVRSADDNTLLRLFNTYYRSSSYGQCDCVGYHYCPATYSIFKKQPYSRQDVNLVRKFTCGFSGFTPYVCCKLFTDYLVFKKHKQKRAYGNRKPTYNIDERATSKHHFYWDSDGFPHWSHAPTEAPTTWNNGHDCEPSVYNHYPNYPTYPRRSTYRPPSQPPPVETTVPLETPPPVPETTTVPATTTTTTTTEAIPAPVVEPEVVIPNPNENRDTKRTALNTQTCGTTVVNRIVGGEDAKLGDYPWMARLGYRRSGSPNPLYRCGGTLISRRYVLTAAHCVSNLPTSLELTTVRLGELDDRNDTDCSGTDCGDPPQDFSPEQVLVHPTYNNPRLSNDIALVRLTTPVTVTRFVSPLCLPFADTLERVQNLTGRQVIVAGWGSTNTGIMAGSATLKWVRLSIISTTQCIQTYRTRFNITVSTSQVCTGGIENMDACEGDSGGPLFFEAETGRRASLIGIVSFGPRRCGTAALPGVYTRVESFLDWILDTIQL
ncbi:CLIP domain-containing serine protease B8-like [Arctopsyche grandis]|uniref:CLIP domain-containing serine protease B8-like n=1 Tax=Arctopsyche grandis TaxID=121162 RepID=UPI00406D89A5